MPRADRVPILPRRLLIAVRVTLNELADVVLIADSGAERTLISQGVDTLLGLDLLRPLRLQRLAGVGQSPPVPVVRFDEDLMQSLRACRRTRLSRPRPGAGCRAASR
jgi:hypothetical protein